MGATLRTYSRSFAGGEITPEMYGRVDDVRFQTGLARCLNFITVPHGPAINRPGFEFVREVKNSARATRLLPFTFSATQTVIIEFGHLYFRFHSQGGTVLLAGAPYEVAHPFQEADLFEVKFVQSADVVTLVHPDYPVQELRRLGATNWTVVSPTFGAGVAAPTGLTATPTTAGASFLRSYSYVVTALNGTAESVSSTAATATNNLNAADTYNDLAWSAVTGATGYCVYRLEGGLYYLIGVTTGNGSVTLRDDNLPYNGGQTPPTVSDPFASSNYPAAVTYFEQRKVFGGTNAQPQNVWTTRVGSELNFNYSIPPRDDDSLQFAIAGREYNQIMHLVPLQDLIIMTQAGEWRLFSGGEAVTPDSYGLRPQSYVGSGHATPLTTGSNLVFADTAGHAREMAFVESAGGYITGDLSLRAPHLFDTFDLLDTAQVKAPYPILWFVSSSGKLLGLTYIPEQQVAGWHQHDTGAQIDAEGEAISTHTFESVAAVREPDQDALYAVIQRQINGSAVRYIERMHTREFVAQADAFFVDAGVYYSGEAISVVTSGLDHLEGETVAILANGAVHPPQVVIDGRITLEEPAETLVIGLPIRSDIYTLPFAAELQGAGQGRVKNVNEVWLRVHRSSGIFVGPDVAHLTEVKQRTTEPYGTPPSLKTDEVNVKISPSWGNNGQIVIRQTDPLPVSLLSLSMEIVLAG